MGSVESRFTTLLVEGKEEEALLIWEDTDNFELQVHFQPNVQIKASPHKDTPLHCAVRYEMRELSAQFLSMGGDPFAMNGKGESPLHLVCRSSKNSSRYSKKRAEFLKLLLDRIPMQETCEVIHKPSSVENSLTASSKSSLFGSFFKEKDEGKVPNGGLMIGGLVSLPDHDAHHLGVQDRTRNTPLHLAAASGLLECVELLVAHDAPLFARNIAGQTPCDVAWEAKQIIIAKQLEAKMVFDSVADMKELGKGDQIARMRNQSFHNTQALKSLKQDIISDMAAKLEISEFSAQALLMAYGWSEELLKEAWTASEVAACEKAGITIESTQRNRMMGGDGDGAPASLTIYSCGICDEDVLSRDKVRVPCDDHVFCEDCWRAYLDGQINEGCGKEIRCPAYQCYKLVPEKVIAKLISDTQMERYSDLTVQNFVDSSTDIRWCPFPDCGYAICIRKDRGASAAAAAEERVKSKEEGGTSEGASALGSLKKMTAGVNVECGQGHGFCWECMNEPHEPCSCELWEKWKDTVITNMSEEDKSRLDLEAKSNAQWITQNTKPCPTCKSPIQKNEGCNHIICKKCSHEFCWVCLDPWRMHSHRTGGYFICNRYSAQQKAKKEVDKARGSIEKEYLDKAHHDLEEQHSKFEHYHSRYQNHLQSLQIEVELLQRSQAKLKEMERLGQALDKKVALVRAMALMDTVEFADEACRSFPNLKGNFLDQIFRALLHARRILASSYCLGYFLPEDRKEALQAHETLQGKLEGAVEVLSQMLNREYLLIPKHKMSEAARNVEFLCEEYLAEMEDIARMAGRVALGIEDEERRIQREEERRREEEERANRPPSPHTIAELQELLFIEHLIRLMDDQGRLHIFVPPEHRGQGGQPLPQAQGGQQPAQARGRQQPPQVQGRQVPQARGGQQPPQAQGRQVPQARGGQQPPQAQGRQVPQARGGQQPPQAQGRQRPTPHPINALRRRQPQNQGAARPGAAAANPLANSVRIRVVARPSPPGSQRLPAGQAPQQQ